MALARDFKETVVERIQRDPAFAKAMLDEAATLFLNGEPDTARVILRDLVNATVGFETLAHVTDKNSKSLHRMLSATGNPTLDNLAAIFSAVRKSLNVKLRMRADRGIVMAQDNGDAPRHAVKLCRLPRLRFFTTSGGALQN